MGNLVKTQILLIGLDKDWGLRLHRQYADHFAIAVAGELDGLGDLESEDRGADSADSDVAVIALHGMTAVLEQRLRALRNTTGLVFVGLSQAPMSKEQANAVGLFAAVTLPDKLGGVQETDFYVRLTCQLRNARLSCRTKRQGVVGKWVAFPRAEKMNHTDASADMDKGKDLPEPTGKVRLIAVGASAGGTSAITKVMQHLDGGLPPIVIVQHMPKDFTGMFANSLNQRCKLPVLEGKDGMKLQSSHIYIAPGDYQTTVGSSGNGFVLHCRQGEKVSGHRPSVDVLFSSVAQNAGSYGVGIILTGMGSDGAQGLLQMRKLGAMTIGQDEATCTVYGMPRSAMEIGAVCQQLPLDEIASAIQRLGTG